MPPIADVRPLLTQAAKFQSGERLPPLSMLAAGLRKTTEILACELASPTPHVPPWSDLEWRLAQAVAAIHGISSLLSTRLRWRGPDGWHRFLDEQRQQTLGRQQRLFDLTKQIDMQSKQADVALMPLKGMALHKLGVYELGERPMADLDLLVRPEQAQAAADLFTEHGYFESHAMWKHRILEPSGRLVVNASLGEHANNPIKVDLHTCIKERLPLSEVDITASLLPARLHAGFNDYSSLAALLRHLLLHAAGNMQSRAVRLIQLHDIALLATRMSCEDWQTLLEAEPAGLWWALPPLQLVARNYPMVIPSSVLRVAHKRCTPWLRVASHRKTLTDFSLSSLPVYAFPGLTWCNSIAECLRYIHRRLRPSRADLDTRKYLAAQPWGAASAWAHMPQWRRMLRWLIGRPPRIETLYVIRLALERQSA